MEGRGASRPQRGASSQLAYDTRKWEKWELDGHRRHRPRPRDLGRPLRLLHARVRATSARACWSAPGLTAEELDRGLKERIKAHAAAPPASLPDRLMRRRVADHHPVAQPARRGRPARRDVPPLRRRGHRHLRHRGGHRPRQAVRAPHDLGQLRRGDARGPAARARLQPRRPRADPRAGTLHDYDYLFLVRGDGAPRRPGRHAPARPAGGAPARRDHLAVRRDVARARADRAGLAALRLAHQPLRVAACAASSWT